MTKQEYESLVQNNGNISQLYQNSRYYHIINDSLHASNEILKDMSSQSIITKNSKVLGYSYRNNLRKNNTQPMP